MTLRELQLAVWEPSDNLRVDLMELWMGLDETIYEDDEAYELLNECIESLETIRKRILWHAEDMARSNISDPTYFTNGKKKSDRRMMLDMKDEFKREIDKI